MSYYGRPNANYRDDDDEYNYGANKDDEYDGYDNQDYAEDDGDMENVD